MPTTNCKWWTVGDYRTFAEAQIGTPLVIEQTPYTNAHTCTVTRWTWMHGRTVFCYCEHNRLQVREVPKDVWNATKPASQARKK
jgi:hypothetical protein